MSTSYILIFPLIKIARMLMSFFKSTLLVLWHRVRCCSVELQVLGFVQSLLAQ